MASYSPLEREAYWQNFWAQHNIYSFDSQNTEKPLYTIDTPPPTVSGNLHIGHIFSYTQAEIIARFKRMTGHNVYYPAGFDDNGIPTEVLVQKELGDQAKDMDRKTFREACLNITQNYREIYKTLWQSLGMSFDREMTYSTISPFVQKIAQERFIELYRKGFILHKEFPALWDRANQTTIAQAETEEIEKDSFFNEIAFDIVGGGTIIIATTRPELITACVAVFVHPDDERYTSYHNKEALTPFGQKIPILTDSKVKLDKGTGAVMCCSYGDETDIYRIQKYKLPEKIIVRKDGRLHNSGLSEIDGLKTHQARQLIIPLLQKTGKLIKQTAIKQGILYSERGKVPVEIIPVNQWFIDITSIKEELIRYGQEMDFAPAHMEKRYDDWINNLERNWNISRSRAFGIPLPLRYTTSGEVVLPTHDQLPVDPTLDLPQSLPQGVLEKDLIPESMVLDTWFTSGLSPDINKAIMQQHGRQDIPEIFDLRPQAHDIIRTRLLYTTVQSHYARCQQPFHHVMISGHVLASKGEKISKSKGNAAFGPKELLAHYGADAVRYRSASGQLGKDIAFEDKELKNGGKLTTKLRNVYQFVKIHFDPTLDLQTNDLFSSSQDLYSTDQWLLSKLNETIKKVKKAYESYEVGLAKIAFEEFFWHDFCDHYLELIKERLYKPEKYKNGDILKKSAQSTLYKAFWIILRLIAPIMPHISEEIYQDAFKSHFKYLSLHRAPFPESDKLLVSQDIENIFNIVSDVRGYKTKHQLSLGAEISLLKISGPQSLLDQCTTYSIDLQGVSKAQEIEYILSEDYHLEVIL